MNNNVHIVINRLAKVFAFVLIISIFSGIIKAAATSVKTIVGHIDHNNASVTQTTERIDVVEGTVKLELNLQAINVNIKDGDSFSYSTNNDYIDVTQSEGKISIIERKHDTTKTANTKLDITLPVDVFYSIISIDSGAGDIDIESLGANKVDLDLGAGNVNIGCMNVSNSVEIDAGAGNFVLEAGTINNCRFDCGVGNVVIGATLLGDSKFDCGVGKLTIDSANPISDYTVYVDKGIGSVKVNGENRRDGDIIGSGANTIKFSSGIGEVSANFAG